MNTRMRTAVQAMKAAPKHDKEMVARNEVSEGRKLKEPGRCLSRRERKIALQKEVDKLRKKLSWEENVHRALQRAFTRPLGALPRLPPYLPSHTLELLAEVAVLEEEVVRLEEQVVNFRRGLYQEAVSISSSKKSIEDGLDSFQDRISSPNTNNSEVHEAQLVKKSSFDGNRHFPSNRIANGKSVPKKENSSLIEEDRGKENQRDSNSVKKIKQSPTKKQTIDKEREAVSSNDIGPNKLSEEILRCLLNIFSRICLPKNAMVIENETSPSVSGSSGGLETEELLDPYSICSEFGRRDIGPYKHLHELEASSVDTNLLTNSSFLMQRLK